jgi:hypothetical protein
VSFFSWNHGPLNCVQAWIWGSVKLGNPDTVQQLRSIECEATQVELNKLSGLKGRWYQQSSAWGTKSSAKTTIAPPDKARKYEIVPQGNASTPTYLNNKKSKTEWFFEIIRRK